jgi:cleavage and polyadenylation specificity factor subunit 2
MEVTSYVPCLLPSSNPNIPLHATVFVNELKLSDFKQVLAKHGVPSEFSGGVLWCAQGTIALRRVREKLS